MCVCLLCRKLCAGGAIWLNPFATVLFSVCSAVTVECCVLYPCCMGVFGMFNNNNNNNCLKSNIQCIEIRVQWTVHLIMFAVM